MTLSVVLGTLLVVISLVLGARWFQGRGAFRGSGTLGSLPSEGVYEVFGAVPMGVKDDGLRVSRVLELEEEYDDAEEPLLSPEEREAEEGAPLTNAGVHLCALASLVLFLLYCSYAQGFSLASPYI